jgi:uncharacterized protein (DUF433 family)
LDDTPVFYGTGVPIEVFFDYLAEGESIGEFLNDFPSSGQQYLEAGEAIVT